MTTMNSLPLVLTVITLCSTFACIGLADVGIERIRKEEWETEWTKELCV